MVSMDKRKVNSTYHSLTPFIEYFQDNVYHITDYIFTYTKLIQTFTVRY